MNMFYKLNLVNMIYIDIETTMKERKYSDLDERMRSAWRYKFKRDKDVQAELDNVKSAVNTTILYRFETENDIYNRLWIESAALYPEFSKVITISMGGYGQDGKFHVKSYYEGGEYNNLLITGEVELLDVFTMVINNAKYKNKTLIAHNGKGFDYPFMIKRYLINNMTPPACLWIYGKKPWEVTLLDSAEVWQFGSRGYSSLDTISAAFGLPSPKGVMDGSEVWKYYYDVEGGKHKIAKYCNNDVISLAQVMYSIMPDENLTIPIFEE